MNQNMRAAVTLKTIILAIYEELVVQFFYIEEIFQMLLKTSSTCNFHQKVDYTFTHS